MNKEKMIKIIMIIIIISSAFYAWQGIDMHNQVTTEEASFHKLQTEYFTQSKAVRDGAETGSDLNKQLVQIKNYPSDLLRLKLVGVGKILTGIFILLLGILVALMSMPRKLSSVIKEQ